MSTITWTKAPWHCWTAPLFSYPASESDDYEPRQGLRYQINQRNLDRFSLLDDVGMAELENDIEAGANLMRWRLQHFTDRHADRLDKLIALGAFAEPDPSSIGLAMIAYRHWEQFGNLLIAEVLVLHMLRMEYTADEVMNELHAEQILRGESRDEGFAAFIADCEVVLRHQRLNKQLGPKSEVRKKVKI